MDAKPYSAWLLLWIQRQCPRTFQWINSSSALGNPTFMTLEYQRLGAANPLHSPGNPSYQKHLKNSSITIKLTWMETQLLKYTIYGMKLGQTRKYKLTRSLTLLVYDSAGTVPQHRQIHLSPVSKAQRPSQRLPLSATTSRSEEKSPPGGG